MSNFIDNENFDLSFSIFIIINYLRIYLSKKKKQNQTQNQVNYRKKINKCE